MEQGLSTDELSREIDFSLQDAPFDRQNYRRPSMNLYSFMLFLYLCYIILQKGYADVIKVKIHYFNVGKLEKIKWGNYLGASDLIL